jgi:hypothetical protein
VRFPFSPFFSILFIELKLTFPDSTDGRQAHQLPELSLALASLAEEKNALIATPFFHLVNASSKTPRRSLSLYKLLASLSSPSWLDVSSVLQQLLGFDETELGMETTLKAHLEEVEAIEETLRRCVPGEEDVNEVKLQVRRWTTVILKTSCVYFLVFFLSFLIILTLVSALDSMSLHREIPSDFSSSDNPTDASVHPPDSTDDGATSTASTPRPAVASLYD